MTSATVVRMSPTPGKPRRRGPNESAELFSFRTAGLRGAGSLGNGLARQPFPPTVSTQFSGGTNLGMFYASPTRGTPARRPARLAHARRGTHVRTTRDHAEPVRRLVAGGPTGPDPGDRPGVRHPTPGRRTR